MRSEGTIILSRFKFGSPIPFPTSIIVTLSAPRVDAASADVFLTFKYLQFTRVQYRNTQENVMKMIRESNVQEEVF